MSEPGKIGGVGKYRSGSVKHRGKTLKHKLGRLVMGTV